MDNKHTQLRIIKFLIFNFNCLFGNYGIKNHRKKVQSTNIGIVFESYDTAMTTFPKAKSCTEMGFYICHPFKIRQSLNVMQPCEGRITISEINTFTVFNALQWNMPLLFHKINVIIYLMTVHAFLHSGVIEKVIVTCSNKIIYIIFPGYVHEASVKSIISDNCIFICSHSSLECKF